MSIETTLARVSAIRQALADPARADRRPQRRDRRHRSPAPAPVRRSASFAAALNAASGDADARSRSAARMRRPAELERYRQRPRERLPVSPQRRRGAGSTSRACGGHRAAQRIVAIAESQLGQTEQPPGSNESPAIAQYRTATAGAMPGAPWCAYFASWVARQAGEPIGVRRAGPGLGLGDLVVGAEHRAARSPTAPASCPSRAT